MSTTQAVPCRRCSFGLLSSTPPSHSLGSIPISLDKVAMLNRSLYDSSPQSREENSSLELEAVAAVHQLSFAVQQIAVSEILPRTTDLLFINVTTMEGTPYCLELTLKGWRICSLKNDCMQGDFTRFEMFIKYYDTVYELMEEISPGYKNRFSEKLAQRLRLLELGEDGDLVAPSSSYINSPLLNSFSPDRSTSSLSRRSISSSNGSLVPSSPPSGKTSITSSAPIPIQKQSIPEDNLPTPIS
ncbi:hypothetical protein QR680_006574 [Steinernema hermaphroditum]|uniref:GSKIP domain-containing protein n=1 Tax=Steinernema hermaphroditum TaxID=289476 RepID=A0AA39LXC6_9BILA|nr:hypothetical protein QR680_006574 [Steinernema hermaphroditum]